MTKRHGSGHSYFGITMSIVICLGLLSPGVLKAQEVPRVIRLKGNPIIRPEMLPGNDGAIINGPSLTLRHLRQQKQG